MFDDTITANLTVDWDWVSENVDSILDIADTMMEGMEDTDALQDFVQDFNINVNSLLGTGNLTTDEISDAVLTQVDGLFGNETSITIGNNTFTEEDILQLLRQAMNSTAFINATRDAGGTMDVSAAFSHFDIVNGTVVLKGVTVTINGVTIELGDLTLTEQQIQELLPQGVVTYSLAIPAEYSVMHNTSSPHGVGAFLGELTAAAWKVSLVLAILSEVNRYVYIDM